jgi:hypothetical protein
MRYPAIDHGGRTRRASGRQCVVSLVITTRLCCVFCFSGLFAQPHGRLCDGQKMCAHVPGGTFGKFSCPLCPWFLDVDAEVPISLEKRQMCRMILSGSTFRCAFQPTPSEVMTIPRRIRPTSLPLTWSPQHAAHVFEEFSPGTTKVSRVQHREVPYMANTSQRWSGAQTCYAKCTLNMNAGDECGQVDWLVRFSRLHWRQPLLLILCTIYSLWPPALIVV